MWLQAGLLAEIFVAAHVHSRHCRANLGTDARPNSFANYVADYGANRSTDQKPDGGAYGSAYGSADTTSMQRRFAWV